MLELRSPAIYYSALYTILCLSLYYSTVDANNQLRPNETKLALKYGYPNLSIENKAVAGYLFADESDRHLNRSDKIDKILSQILLRDSPDMRPSRGYKDWPDIDTKVSMKAWSLMHSHASIATTNYATLSWPAIQELLMASDVSEGCYEAVEATFEGVKRLDSWAIKLMNSWGSFPPSGIFEGTYSTVGSFHTCVGIDPNNLIDHAHYCSLTFKPILPARRDYELVVTKEPDELLKMFEIGKEKLNSTNNNHTDQVQFRDALTDILEHAQYHHFVYYKWGTCWPIKCSPFDVKRVVRVIGQRNLLLHGPVKCYSMNETDYEEPGVIINDKLDSSSKDDVPRKLIISVWNLNDGIYIWKPYLLPIQKVAFAILALLSVFIFTMTTIDMVCNRIPYLYDKARIAMRATRLGLDANTRPKYLSNPRLRDNSNECGENGNAQNLPLTRKYNAIAIGSQVQYNQPDIAPANSDLEPGDIDENSHAIDRATSSRQDKTGRSTKSTFMSYVEDFSIVSSAKQFFFVKPRTGSDIFCLDGIRCITMIWVILAHTMAYNDWSAWSRTREVEKSLISLINQPLFNGTYLVDTFFLMSGLLSSYTVFKHSRDDIKRFNPFIFILARWLRLTPQIFLISLILIIFPTLSCGPHWFPIVGEFSENCYENWWVNLLHIQAFYRSEKMCNFVTWWISIDFLYHVMAIGIILIFLRFGHKIGFASLLSFIIGNVSWQVYRHYELGLPPNILSTIPQTGAMWTTMTLEFFWTPYAHAVPFYFGFYIGYLIALKRDVVLRYFNTRKALIGWIVSITLIFMQGYSTFWWIKGAVRYTKIESTIFFTISPIAWAGSICWIIMACHHGYGGFINRFLSAGTFIILGKASYIVYLSHFHILFLYYGQQNLLLEPSHLQIGYITFGNILISTVYGTVLCIIYEIPWLRMQRRLMQLL